MTRPIQTSEISTPELSFGQERMWFLEQLEPDTASNNCSTILELSGVLNAAHLEQCVNEIVRRHEALRTRFDLEHGRPVQIIEPTTSIYMRIVDLSEADVGEPEIRQLALEELARVFVLSQLPLMRLTLFRCGPAMHVLQLTTHHIIWDAWSVNVFLKELFELYGDYRLGDPSQLAPLRHQYRDFAFAERDMIESSKAQRDLAFWRDRLADLPVQSLPVDFRRRTSRTFRGAAYTFELPEELSESIHIYCSERAVSGFMFVLAALQLFLSLLSGEKRVAVGVPVANRNKREWEHLIGSFINVLVFQTGINDKESFEELLQRVRGESLTIYEHGEYPFIRLVEELNPSRSASLSPLFQVMLVFLNARSSSLELGGLSGSFWNVESITAKQDLTLTIGPRDGRFLGSWEYDSNLFLPQTIARLSRQFIALISALVEGQPMSPESMLSQVEESQIETSNSTSQPGWLKGNLARLIALDQPADRIAIESRDHQVSFGALRNQTAGWTAKLKALRVGIESPVGILMSRTPDVVVAMLAVLEAGGTYVPIDERWPEHRIEDVVKAAGLTLLLVDAATRELAKRLPVQLLAIDSVPFSSGEATVDRLEVVPSNCAYTIFTSGSTGKPKGIQITHEAVWNLLRSFESKLSWGSDVVMLAVTTIAFDIAVLEWALPLMIGGRCVIVSHDQARDPRELALEIARCLPTSMQATPSLWRMLADSGWTGEAALQALAGGEALAEDLAQKLRTLCREVWNLYGPTETTIWSMASRVGDQAPHLGRPIGNTASYLINSRFERLPVGFEGEIVIAGSGLARCYLNQPALTAERFVPDSFGQAPGARMFRTGDLGRRDAETNLCFVGRADYQLKIRGVRVEAQEIEGCLRLHEAIQEAVVKLAGEGPDARLVGYVTVRSDVPEERQAFLFRSLMAFLAERLPEPMIPRQFVVLDEMPLMSSGKIDRLRLSDPPQLHYCPASRDLLFLSPIEQDVYEAWKRCLGVQRIGLNDNFFDLGGNSLLAAQVCTTLSRIVGVPVPVKVMFEAPLFQEFSHRVQDLRNDKKSEEWPTIEADPTHRFEPFPLTDVQEAYLLGRSGLFELGDVATHSYFEIDSARIDVDRFEIVWRMLIERHDMLRAVFLQNGTQRILPSVPAYYLQRRDASALTEEERERVLGAVREEMSHALHRADQWPLFEIRATKLNDSLTRFHFSLDALIGDAFSSVLLLGDWRALYLDLEASLPEIGIQFRDYVLGLRSLEDSDMFRRSERYWVDRLDEGFRGPDLPIVKVDRGEASRFSRRNLKLPKDAWQVVRTRALNRGLSPTTVVLAAFAEVLAYWSRTQRFVLNLTLFNRLPLHPDVNRIVGDFTSITLLEVDAGAPSSFVELADRTQQRLWNDLDHRMYSGVRVLREMRRRFLTGQEILAPVVFTSTLGMTPNQDPGEAWGQEVYSISQTPQVWLDHKVFEENDGLGVDWDFADSLFPEGVIDSMFGAYRSLLKALAEDEETWNISRGELHSRLFPNTQQVCEERRFDGADTLHGMFLEQAWRAPERLAVISPTRRLTYGQLDAWSSFYASRLIEAGIAAEELVGVVAPKGWEQAVAILGILRSGGAYLPIEASEPEDRRLRIMRSSNARFALTTGILAESLHWPEGCTPIAIIPDVVQDRFQDAAVSGDRLAYVIHTSGSTGQPKGVMIEHSAAVNTLRDLVLRLELGPDDRTLALSALSFDLSVFDCFGVWAAGGAVVYPDAEKAKDPSHWSALIESERVSVWNSVPALMELLVETSRCRETALRWILLSGDWIPVSLPPRVASCWPAAHQISLGGATEASIWSILFPIDRVDPEWVRIPYGRAMWNQTVTVRNLSLECTPAWVIGEIFIGGAGLARGYLASPELTSERFVIHPASGERLYRTGDLGRYRASGDIEILGRADHQVKVNGYRIELAEIEAVIETQSGIQQAVVNVENDSGGRKELVAYLLDRPPASGPALDNKGLMATVKSKLAQRAIRRFSADVETVPLRSGAAPGDLDRIRTRQSYRSFTDDTPASLDSVEDWLRAVELRTKLKTESPRPNSSPLEWFENVICRLRQTNIDGSIFPKYQYPSAGHLYPVQSYFSVPKNSIPGLSGGHYYYDPRANQLVRLAHHLEPSGSAIRMVLVAEMAAIEDEYHDASWRFCALEAGYMSAMFLDAGLKVVETPSTTNVDLALETSHRVIAAYGMAPGPSDLQSSMATVLIWVRSGGLHGGEPGFYVRHPGGRLSKQSEGGAVDPAWFGPNQVLLERSHFAIACLGGDADLKALMNAGALGQIMMEEAPRFNLGICPIGEISNRFVEAASTSGEILHGWLGGRIDPVQTTQWMTVPQPLDRNSLRKRCRDRVARQLPTYMHPVRYVFVDKMPLTANNKVDRKMLMTMVPEDETQPATSKQADTGSEVERDVAQILASILKRPVADLDQSFFEMGASSLIIIQLYSQLNTRYPDMVSFQNLFDNPSVRAVARLIGPRAPISSDGDVVEVLDL